MNETIIRMIVSNFYFLKDFLKARFKWFCVFQTVIFHNDTFMCRYLVTRAVLLSAASLLSSAPSTSRGDQTPAALHPAALRSARLLSWLHSNWQFVYMYMLCFPACLGAGELVSWHTEVKVQPTWTTISATVKIIIKWCLIFLFIKYIYRTDTCTVWFYPEPFVSYINVSCVCVKLRLHEAPLIFKVNGHQRCLIGMLPRPKRL